MKRNYKPEFDRAIDDLDLVRRHFEPSDLDSNEYDGSLLHLASKFGTPEVVRFLLDKGAELNRRGGTFDAPPVAYAAANGRLDLTQLLVEAGAHLDESDSLRNPLMRAASRGHFNVVEYLLTTNIDPHATYRITTGADLKGTPKVWLDGPVACPLDSDGSFSWRQEKHAQTGAWRIRQPKRSADPASGESLRAQGLSLWRRSCERAVFRASA